MRKLLYVVKDKQGAYNVGLAYGTKDLTEGEAIIDMTAYTEQEGYESLILLLEVSLLPIINQIYPPEPTGESNRCLCAVLKMIMNEEDK